MSIAPEKVWICRAGAEPHDWIVERMTTADIAADGSFEIEATDGLTQVKPGEAVFAVGEAVYAAPPRLIADKLKSVVGTDAAPVAELVEKQTKLRDSAERSEASRVERQGSARSNERPLKLKPIIGSPPAPQFLAIGDLRVDDRYQRSIEGGASRTLIRKIAENWDWRLCLPLLISRRDGDFFVIDGQHRKEGAELRGDIAHLPAVVFDLDDPKAEAELFVAANRSRRQMSKLDDHHAAVIAGDKKAMTINEVVTNAGLQVARIAAWQYWQPGDVVFVGAIQRMLNSHGRPVVEQALGLIGRAFEGSTLVGGGALFEGLITFSQQRVLEGAPIDEALMQMMLSQVGLPGWKEATEGIDAHSDRADAMVKAIADAYSEAEAE